MGKDKKNKGQKKVALSLSDFSKQYGISLFEDNNALKLPTGPSVMATSSYKDGESFKKDNWRGNDVSSNPLEKSKADEDNNWRSNNVSFNPREKNKVDEDNNWRSNNISFNPREKNKVDEDNNWRRSSNNEKVNSVIDSNTSKFSFQNIKNKNSFVPSQQSRFLSRNRENLSTSKFSFQKNENKSMFVPSYVKKVSNRFNFETVPTSPNISKRFSKMTQMSSNISKESSILLQKEPKEQIRTQFWKEQDILSKKHDLLIEKTIQERKQMERFMGGSFDNRGQRKSHFQKEHLKMNNQMSLKTNLKVLKKKRNALFEHTEKDREMLKNSYLKYQEQNEDNEESSEEIDDEDNDLSENEENTEEENTEEENTEEESSDDDIFEIKYI